MLVVAELMGPEEAEEFYFSELKRGKRIKDMDPGLLHGWTVHVAALPQSARIPKRLGPNLPSSEKLAKPRTANLNHTLPWNESVD